MDSAAMMKVELRVGERLTVGDAEITLEKKSGQVARLSIKAARTVPVQHERGETRQAYSTAT